MTTIHPSRGKGGFVLAGLCLALAACERGDGSAGASLEQSVAAPRSQMMALASAPGSSASGSSAPGSTAPGEAVASLPPEAGEVAAVRGRTYVDGYRQDIFLRGSPVAKMRNGITVLTRTTSRPTLDEATPLYKPAEAGIRAELGAQFPKIAMQVVERPSSNAYGPYGLALGRAEGDVRCLYMWQWIDANRLPPDAGLPGPASVRIRLCQKATTFDAMAALIDHLSIHAGAATVVATAGGAGIVEAPTAEAAKPMHRRHAARHPRVVEAPSGVAPAVPLAAPAAPAVAPVLAMDLPPQALQGPKATSSVAKPN